MIRRFLTPIYLFIVFVLGFVVTQFLADLFHHRYYDGDYGLYNGSVHAHGSFFCIPLSEFQFHGKSESGWYWIRPKNFQYHSLELKWDYTVRINGEYKGFSGSGILSFPSLKLDSGANSIILTPENYCRTCYGVAYSDLTSEQKEVVDQSYKVILSAGEGKLPRPQHHAHHLLERQIRIQHFSSGPNFSYLTIVWLFVWILYILRRVDSTEVKRNSPVKQEL